MRRLLILAPALLAACGPNAAPPAASAPAAKVTGAVPEAALATLTLTDAATTRLGIETAQVERRRIATTRSLGGEVLPAGGAQLTVTAPVAGTLSADGPTPVVGAAVASGALVLTLVPLAPAERDVRVEAERVVAEAVGRQEMAAKRAQRARLLAQDGAGSVCARPKRPPADLAVADAALDRRTRSAGAGRAGRERVGGDSSDVTPRGCAAGALRECGADRRGRCAALRRRRPRHGLAASAGVCRRPRCDRSPRAGGSRLPRRDRGRRWPHRDPDCGAPHRRPRHRGRGSLLSSGQRRSPACVPASG